MKQQILQIAAQKGDSAVREFISRSIRDLKAVRCTRAEIVETMIDLTPDQYHSFVRTECNAII